MTAQARAGTVSAGSKPAGVATRPPSLTPSDHPLPAAEPGASWAGATGTARPLAATDDPACAEALRALLANPSLRTGLALRALDRGARWPGIDEVAQGHLDCDGAGRGGE